MLIDEPSPSITTPPASEAAILSVPMARSDAAAFARLTLELREAGLLEPRSRRYVVSILGYAALMVAAWTAFALTGSFWLAPVIGLLYARMGYHLHDLSHFHTFHSRRWNDHAAHFGLLRLRQIALPRDHQRTTSTPTTVPRPASGPWR